MTQFGGARGVGELDRGHELEHQRDVVQRLHVEEVKTGERSTLDVAGVFPYLGLTPNTQFLNGLVPLNGRGQILTDLWMRTAVPGVLAAGGLLAACHRLHQPIFLKCSGVSDSVMVSPMAS